MSKEFNEWARKIPIRETLDGSAVKKAWDYQQQKINKLQAELEKERMVVDKYASFTSDYINDDGELIEFGTFDGGKLARQQQKERK